MMPSPAQQLDVLPDEEEQISRTGLRDYATAPVKFKKQIADVNTWLSDRWNGERLQDTEASRRDCAPVLDLLAVYRDGPERMDEFLESSTSFGDGTRQRLKQIALAGDRKGHSPKRLGQLIGLDWLTRQRLKITNIDAIDTPPEEAREALQKEYDTAYSRNYRAAKRSLPKPPPIGKRKAAELWNRRSAAIHAAVGPGEGMSVKDLCNILSRPRNGPFRGVSKNSLPRAVHRAVAADTVRLQSELRPFSGRPDLKPQMWVARHPPTSADQVKYRNHFAARLAEFTQNTAAALAAWFYSDAERDLREASGFDRDAEEFMKMARARRAELTGKPLMR